MPENLVNSIKTRIKREWIICFVSVFVFGLTAHLYRFMNWQPNWDAVVYRYDELNMTHIGRIFSKLSCMFTSYYDLPWINGLFSLVFIALSSIVICELFELKNKISLVLISGLMVTFPTVASTFAFSYTADGYFMAIFASCLAVFLIDKKGIMKNILGILLIAFALGVYQAYITVSVMLILIYLLNLTIFRKESLSLITKKLVKFFVSGLAAAALYWVLVKVYMLVSGSALTEYQGASEAFNLANVNISLAIRKCLYFFKEYYFDFSNGITLFTVLNIIMFVIIGICGISAVFRKEKNSVGRVLYAVLFALVMPFGTRMLLFVDSNMDCHNLTLMSSVFFNILMVLFYEKFTFNGNTPNKIKQWSIFIVTSLMIYNFTLISNISYHTMQISYEKSYSVATRITDRIEQTEGIENCNKISVIGNLAGSEEYSYDITPDMTGFTKGYILREPDEVIADQFVVATFLREYTGLELENADEEYTKAFEQSKDFEKMKPWPAKESVFVKDDTVIVYLGK